jgi:hypothetical protein
VTHLQTDVDNFKTHGKIGPTMNERKPKKKIAKRKTAKKTAKTAAKKAPVKKQPPQMPPEATKPPEAISPIKGKTKKKPLGKSKVQIKLRAKKIAAGLIAGKNQGDILREIGYSETVAQNPSGVLQNALIKKTYCEILDAAGATDERCARVISEGMEAMRTVSCISGKDADSKTVDFVDVIDHPVRLKAVDMVHKVRGRYVEKKPTGDDGSLTIKIVDMSDAELLILARRGRSGAPSA